MRLPSRSQEADRLEQALVRSAALGQVIERTESPKPVTLRCNRTTCNEPSIRCWICKRKTCRHHTSKNQIGVCTVCALRDWSDQ